MTRSVKRVCMIQASAMRRRGEYVIVDMNHDFDTLNKRHIQLFLHTSSSHDHFMHCFQNAAKSNLFSMTGIGLADSFIIAKGTGAFNNKHPSDMV